MSRELLRALERARPDATYREIMDEVSSAVSLEVPAQHPQLEGDFRRVFLGGPERREPPFIRIAGVTGNRVSIGAGAAQGIREGAMIAIYAPDAARLAGDAKRIANGVVTKAAATTADVEVPDASKVTTGAKAIVVSPGFTCAPLRVALGPPMPAGPSAAIAPALASALAAGLANDPLFALVPAKDSAWDVAVLVGRFGSVFNDPAAPGRFGKREGERLPADADAVLYVAGRDNVPLYGFFVKPDRVNGAALILQALGRCARQRNLRTLNNNLSSLADQVRMTVVRSVAFETGNGTETREEPLDESRNYVFREGEWFRLRIVNESERPLYVTLISLGVDGEIYQEYPAKGASEPFESGIPKETLWATVGAPVGTIVYKALVTTEPADFGFLLEGAVDRGTPKTPLGLLAKQANTGARSAGSTDVASTDSWGTTQILVSVVPK